MAERKLEDLSLSEIAYHISANWSKVNYAAHPYLVAMSRLQSIDDTYGYDSGQSVVRYFLANAGTWRGDVAKEIKAELKRRLNQ